MKGFSKLVVSSCVLVLLAVPAAGDEAKAAAKAKPAPKLVTMTPDQMTWVANPGVADVKVATAWGDMNKGAHGSFHKFPAGFASPLHTHSADVRIVVISGTLIEATEDGKETKLPAGSYVYQPHTVKHFTKCDAASECVIFAVANGKFDLIPADGKKADEKKEEPKK